MGWLDYKKCNRGKGGYIMNFFEMLHELFPRAIDKACLIIKGVVGVALLWGFLTITLLLFG